MKTLEQLNHPCKDTCNGWQQGYDKGKAEIVKALSDAPLEFDEMAFRGWLDKEFEKAQPPLYSDCARWQLVQSALTVDALRTTIADQKALLAATVKSLEKFKETMNQHWQTPTNEGAGAKFATNSMLNFIVEKLTAHLSEKGE